MHGSEKHRNLDIFPTVSSDGCCLLLLLQRESSHLLTRVLRFSFLRVADLSMFELAGDEKKKLEQAPVGEHQGTGSSEISTMPQEKQSSMTGNNQEAMLQPDRHTAKTTGESVAMEQSTEASMVDNGALQMPSWLEDGAVDTTENADDDVVNDPLLDTEDQQDVVVDSLTPVVAKKSKQKKRPRFRSVRKKNVSKK